MVSNYVLKILVFVSNFCLFIEIYSNLAITLLNKKVKIVKYTILLASKKKKSDFIFYFAI